MTGLTPHFSTGAIGALLLTMVVGSVVLIRKYPDGIDEGRPFAGFPRMFMVTSACFGCVMAVVMTLIVTGQITFEI
jgi:hypothetical protein